VRNIFLSQWDGLTMLRDGEYAAWFRSSRGEGTAIVRLENGKITGGDNFFSYSGDYEVDGDRFMATLTTRRRAAGPTAALGLDEIELKLTGTLRGMIACCSGRSEQAPDIQFEATVFLGQEGDRPIAPRPISDFARLRTHNERHRAHRSGPGALIPLAADPSLRRSSR
jgi:hypothetical protein